MCCCGDHEVLAASEVLYDGLYEFSMRAELLGREPHDAPAMPRPAREPLGAGRRAVVISLGSIAYGAVLSALADASAVALALGERRRRWSLH